MEKRILVTGGAGFIGHRVCRLLAAQGSRVAIVDNLHVGMAMPEDALLQGFLEDIRDEGRMDEIFAEFKPHTVIHLAAIHHIPTCEKQRSFAQHVNILGTENVLRAAERHDTAQCIIASSGAVYDWLDAPLNESTTPLFACDNYALCKLTNESQLRFWVERTGAKAKVVRIFNTIGHDDPNAHLIPDILNQLHNVQGEAKISLGNISPKRDYIHADDVARGIVAVAAYETDEPYDIVNVGSGQEVSVEQLVRTISAEMGVGITIGSDPSRVRRVDRERQLADVSKIKSRAGWQAKISLGDAIKDIVAKFDFAAAE